MVGRPDSQREMCGKDGKLRAHVFSQERKAEKAHWKWGEALNFQSLPQGHTSPNTTSSRGPRVQTLKPVWDISRSNLLGTYVFSGTLVTTHLLSLVRVRASQTQLLLNTSFSQLSASFIQKGMAQWDHFISLFPSLTTKLHPGGYQERRLGHPKMRACPEFFILPGPSVSKVIYTYIYICSSYTRYSIK